MKPGQGPTPRSPTPSSPRRARKSPPTPQALLAGAGIVFAVQAPGPEERALIPRGALLVCIAGAFADPELVPGLAAAGIDAAAMELLPRITRAQSMDVLSSQANLAGYRAVVESATAFQRGFPMMMTAAGTVPPARVFVIGAGVAGLQAIATARRLGAIVSATDVRPAAKEEIKSLGATFVGRGGRRNRWPDRRLRPRNERRVPPEAGRADGRDRGQERHRHLHRAGDGPQGAGHRHPADGRQHARRQRHHRPGGRCRRQLRRHRSGPEHHDANGVTILGYYNWPGRIPVASSSLYARNLLTFLTTFWDKDSQGAEPAGDRRHRQRRHADPWGRRRSPELPAATGRLSLRRLPDGPEPIGGRGRAPRRPGASTWPTTRRLMAIGVTTTVAPEVNPFIFLLAIFLMACFVGYYVVWNVTPALHSPLMAVTNAISSVIIVGAMLATGLGYLRLGHVLRLHRRHPGLGQHLRRLHGDAADALDVQEEAIGPHRCPPA